MGSRILIKTYKPQPVAILLASKATASLPMLKLSAMIPDPTIETSNMAVPINSAINLVFNGATLMKS